MTDPDRNTTGPPSSDPLAPTLAQPAGSAPVLSMAALREPDVRFDPPKQAGELGTFGRYRVLKKLGQGGMGAVYLGFDSALDRPAALKMMLPRHAADPESRARFLREARTAAKIKSDHVVTIFDVGEHRGTPFIAMEYLQGSPLDQFLHGRGELPLTHVLRVGHETALGLAAAHDLGLIHRDIKPGNMWLEAPKGRVKLLDFGLARAQNDDTHLTGSGMVVGTPAFMSPEQARGHKLDGRSDLFSLGVVLYRLATGKMPFDGPTTMAVLTALAVDDPPAPRALNPQLPGAVEAVILKLLAKNPTDRYATAAAAAEALAAAAHTPHAGPSVVALPLTVAPQNVWEGIDQSGSVAVPLPESGPTEAAPRSSRVTRPRGGSSLPLILGGGALALAAVAVAAVLLWPNKKSDVVPVEPDRASPAPALPKVPRPAPPPTPERRLAEAVLTKGGAVRVAVGDRVTVARQAGELPGERFDITGVELHGMQWTTADVAQFRDIKTLTRFMIHGTAVDEQGQFLFRGSTQFEEVQLELSPVSDVGAGSFGGNKELRLLSLSFTKIGDPCLGYFVNCNKLRHLSLVETNVTDAGLAKLANNPELIGLAISKTKTTDAALRAFAANPKVQDVEFAETAIGDAGFAHLARWRELKFVNALGSKVTDAGLVHLKGLPLVYLDLRNTAVTDAGLLRLSGLTTMTKLHLTGTQVTAAGVAELRKALPNCDIEWIQAK